MNILARNERDARMREEGRGAGLEELLRLLDAACPKDGLFDNLAARMGGNHCIWCRERVWRGGSQVPTHKDSCPWLKARAALTSTPREGTEEPKRCDCWYGPDGYFEACCEQHEVDYIQSIKDAKAKPVDPPADREQGLWRVGTKVPLNVYHGDRPVCQCHSEADALEIVRNGNQREQVRPRIKHACCTADDPLYMEGNCVPCDVCDFINRTRRANVLEEAARFVEALQSDIDKASWNVAMAGIAAELRRLAADGGAGND